MRWAARDAEGEGDGTLLACLQGAPPHTHLGLRHLPALEDVLLVLLGRCPHLRRGRHGVQKEEEKGEEEEGAKKCLRRSDLHPTVGPHTSGDPNPPQPTPPQS